MPSREPPGQAGNRRQLIQAVEAGQRERGVFRLADEHPVDVRRAQHRRLRRRRGVRPETEHRRAEVRLQLGELGDVGVERRRRAREQDQRRLEALAIEAADQIFDRAALGGEIDQPDVAPRVAQHRGQQRQRVGRLGRAEDLLALLAAPLAGEGDAVDERRIDEQRLLSDHVCTTVTGMARRRGMSAVATAGTGDSSTLQHRRQTGKIPCSSRRLRMST